MTDALRPGELFALRWRGFNYRERTMQVTETVYKGKIRPWGKTPKSLGPVHIPKHLADDLRRWQQHYPNSSPDAFIFPNKSGGFMDPDNYRKRVLHKLAEQLGIPRLTFQVIRRSIATLAQRKGTVKDVQGMLRHSRTPTTTDVYMQVMPHGVQATVNAINAELRRKTRNEAKKMGTLLPNATKLGEGVPASC
jgi:integrase